MESPPSSGKTTWAFSEINKLKNRTNSYVYCTPFLSEVNRCIEKTKLGLKKRFKQPQPYNFDSKIDHFNYLLSEGEDIATTHATLLNATKETIDILEENDYTLILDEAIDVIQDFNQLSEAQSDRQRVTKTDVKTIINSKIITVDEDMKVHWNSEPLNPDNKFYAVYHYAKLGNLYCIGDYYLITIYPPEIFKTFKKVYVLTYMFDCSLLKHYFDKFNIPYEYKTISGDLDNGFQLTEYTEAVDQKFKEKCLRLIHICNNSRLNDFKKNSLNSTWYSNRRKQNDPELIRLRRNLKYYFTKEVEGARASHGDIMWTTYADYRKALQGAKYSMIRSLTAEELKQDRKNHNKENENRLSCFLSCNARASNDYDTRWALAYCINFNINPELPKFFKNSKFPKKRYSLSSMLQWIFRSRIRHDQPIWIYIPSPRMRELYYEWVHSK